MKTKGVSPIEFQPTLKSKVALAAAKATALQKL
jgi:hypothetical protein